ncbi:MAG TPA: glycosyltransferase family 4 protein [Rhizomicrobium sp.]
MGAELTVLYYATEGLSASEARRMKEAWGSVEVVYPRGFVPRSSLVRCPAIDDWYDKAVGAAAAILNAEKRFDACIVNYAWYSKIFESLLPDVVRIIDTHDVFGGRAEKFAAIDLAPQWFHTSIAQEKVGLDRADFVLAIQDVEAEILRQRTTSQVWTVGMLSAAEEMPATPYRVGRPLKVGYVGSGNPFNVSSMVSFARALQAAPAASRAFDVHLAGSICAALPAAPHPFITHGIVDSVSGFYRSMDVVVNPMLGGTGLKVKSLEALGFGKPLVATLDAMAGIDSRHDGHRFPDMEQVVRRLQALSGDPDRLLDEAEISRGVFESYRRMQLLAFSQFWSRLEQEIVGRRAARSAPPVSLVSQC